MKDQLPGEETVGARDLKGPGTLAEPLLSADRDAAFHTSDALLDSLFDDVARQSVDRAPGLRDRLRELATPTRVALMAVGSLAIGLGATVLTGVRADLDAQTVVRLGLVDGALLLTSLLGASLALRPVWRGPLGVWSWVVASSLLLTPLVLAFVPGLWPGFAGPIPAVAHLMCGGGGLMVALPATALVVLLDRDTQPSLWRVAMAAGAAGVVALAWGQLHCPAIDPTHLLVGHGLQGLVSGGVVLAGVGLLGRLAR